MSKERLEEIKEQVKYLQGDLMRDDLGWLIEQAERAQELEREKSPDARQVVLEGLYAENKRYRQALYFLELKLSDFKEYTNKIKKLSDEKMIKDYAVRFLEDISETEQALKEDTK